MTEKIHLQRYDNGIAVLTFNRPQSRNALDIDAMQQFAAQIEALHADESLRGLIVTGAGEEAFCSGGDLFELHTLKTEEQAREFTTLMGDALRRMETLPVPVLAAINGYALGGGSEIAMACDLRIADSRVKMGFVQANMGLIPGWGAGQRLIRLVGYSTAMRMLLTGEVLHAAALQNLGLIEAFVEPGRALDAVMSFAEHNIAPHPPQVVRSIKVLLRAGLENDYETALSIERDLFPPLWTGEAHIQAVEAFLARRQSKKESAE